MKNYINKLMELAVKYNSDDFHVFVWFYGHTHKIDLDIHCGDWRPNDEPSLRVSFCIDGHSGNVDAFNACRALLKMYRAWKKNKTIWKPDKTCAFDKEKEVEL